MRDDAQARHCPGCDQDLPIAAFRRDGYSRPRVRCHNCEVLTASRRAHVRRRGSPRRWDQEAVDLLRWELDLPINRGNRDKILAFWGISEAYLDAWEQRRGHIETPVTIGLDFLLDVEKTERALDRSIQEMRRQLNVIEQVVRRTSRELNQAVEGLGARLAALEAELRRR